MTMLLLVYVTASSAQLHFRKSYFRSTHQRCSVKKGNLKNFANFKGKHLCWSLFLIKLQVLKLLVTVSTSSEQLFLLIKQFDTIITFSEQLFLKSILLWSSYFFRIVTSSQQLFFQNSYFFRAKLVPSRQFLVAASFSQQLLFRKAVRICLE